MSKGTRNSGKIQNTVSGRCSNGEASARGFACVKDIGPSRGKTSGVVARHATDHRAERGDNNSRHNDRCFRPTSEDPRTSTTSRPNTAKHSGDNRGIRGSRTATTSFPSHSESEDNRALARLLAGLSPTAEYQARVDARSRYCDICGAKFGDSASLRCHTKSAHVNKQFKHADQPVVKNKGCKNGTNRAPNDTNDIDSDYDFESDYADDGAVEPWGDERRMPS